MVLGQGNFIHMIKHPPLCTAHLKGQQDHGRSEASGGGSIGFTGLGAQSADQATVLANCSTFERNRVQGVR
jgi:hypothetical protein